MDRSATSRTHATTSSTTASNSASPFSSPLPAPGVHTLRRRDVLHRACQRHPARAARVRRVRVERRLLERHDAPAVASRSTSPASSQAPCSSPAHTRASHGPVPTPALRGSGLQPTRTTSRTRATGHARRDGASARGRGPTGPGSALPPWALSSRMRLKPLRITLSRRSSRSAM